MLELLCHLVGDYCLQNQWMASNKVKRSWPCLVHCLLYTLPFLLLTQDWADLAIIFSTHFLIDRFRLASYWVHWYGIGKGDNVPAFLSVWLTIIVDNTAHLAINHVVLNYV